VIAIRTALRRRLVGPIDAGLTLVELMVTLVLMGVVGTIMLGATVMVSRTVTNAQASGDSLDIARVGMNRMARSIRAGIEISRSGQANQPAIDTMGANTLIMYSSLGASPTKITYAIDANRNLTETVVAAGGTSPYWTFTGTPKTTIIAYKVPTTAANLFTYLDSNGAVLAAQSATDDATTGLVKQIQINLQVDANPGKGVGPVTLTNTVVLPNLGVAKR
jgi:prepilin-type N-terminal cleavage/methylation domain-containing protein